MGDGFGGKGKRLEKGIGMRTGEGGTLSFAKRLNDTYLLQLINLISSLELALMRGRRCQPWSIEDID